MGTCLFDKVIRPFYQDFTVYFEFKIEIAKIALKFEIYVLFSSILSLSLLFDLFIF